MKMCSSLLLIPRELLFICNEKAKHNTAVNIVKNESVFNIERVNRIS
jgi:hypothetical protein